METRIRQALSLYAFGLLGVFLSVVPWTAVWTEATMVLVPTSIEAWFLSGWMRGLVSGLGALDLVVAIELFRDLWVGMGPGRSPIDRT